MRAIGPGGATAVGLVAILLWALLALLTVVTAPVPPFLLNVLSFAIGGAAGLVWAATTGALSLLRHVPMRIYVIGTLGLFAYHAVYFTAFRLAAPLGASAEAGLIAYLWPLLIVLLSGLLPGERVRPLHIVGAGLAFAGAGLIVVSGGQGLQVAALPAYGLALACAFIWSGYSVLSRRFGQVPTVAVAIYCLGTASLSLPLHLIFEETVWPGSAAGWAAVLSLGLGPVGLAFYVWDIGMKRGDIQFLGTASYAAPLLSTIALVSAGMAQATMSLAIAALLIAAGAALAAWAGRTPG